jgi:hypothetical protein
VLAGWDAFTIVGNHLVDAVQARLRDTPAGVPPRAGMVPSPIVWDQCDCGLLAVAVARIYPSVAPPADAATVETPTPTAALPWPPFLVGQYQVAVLRCATTDAVPTADQLASEHEVVQRDAYETLVAVTCTLHALYEGGDIEDYEVADQPFLPAQGGCQGGQLNATVTVPFLCPC